MLFVIYTFILWLGILLNYIKCLPIIYSQTHGHPHTRPHTHTHTHTQRERDRDLLCIALTTYIFHSMMNFRAQPDPPTLSTTNPSKPPLRTAMLPSIFKTSLNGLLQDLCPHLLTTQLLFSPLTSRFWPLLEPRHKPRQMRVPVHVTWLYSLSCHIFTCVHIRAFYF